MGSDFHRPIPQQIEPVLTGRGQFDGINPKICLARMVLLPALLTR
jgi:hypothetical protein